MTAELYRLASLLYLQRAVPTFGDDLRRIDYSERALEALATLGVATSPWPVFITACETQTDEQRIRILEVLDHMAEFRNVGNVYVMRGIIETTWKQQDLRDTDNKSRGMQWWLCIDSSVLVPWFA